MADIKELCRLTAKNKERMIQIFKIQGYEYMLVVEEVLESVFEDVRDYVFTDVRKCEPGRRGILLCVDKDSRILDLEQSVPGLKCIVLFAEYNRMMNQLSFVTEESIRAYRRLFGYSSIVYAGENECIRQLDMLDRSERREEADTLYITEYIDTRDWQEDRREGHQLGMRQFLYELEVLATFPEEIEEDLENRESLEAFIFRFCDIFLDTGWRILFSEKTPLADRAVNRYQGEKVAYAADANLSCTDIDKVMLIQNGNLLGTEQFYQENRRNHRIVVRRFLVLFRTWIMENLCGYFQESLKEKGVRFHLVNWNWAMNNPLHPRQKVTSQELEARESYHLYKIKEHPDAYKQFLEGIYEEKYTEEYLEQIFAIPNKMELEPGKIRHENKKSTCINVTNGERYTAGQPGNSKNTIYMLGGCVFFGYAAEDSQTISSFLQKEINERVPGGSWKVANMGTWGGNIDQTYKQLYDLKFRSGDIVIVSYAGYMPIGTDYRNWDISSALNSPVIDEHVYFNSVVHCNYKGYELVARKLFLLLEPELEQAAGIKDSSFYLKDKSEDMKQDRMYQGQAQEYLRMVKEETPDTWKKGTTGAIVMNCNPFTLGHKYLISKAAGCVDHLYIFVVEEDRSFFPFEDRIQLVKAGTKEFENVIVVPSGKLIISSVTFPGYFLKDSPDAIGVDTAMDVDIFAKYIAAPLNITRRFVGEEPIDLITRSYNESMKDILPRYGIEVSEIPRKEASGGVISASRVRRALKTGDFDIIRRLVPDTTLQYLQERKEQYLEKEKEEGKL